MPAPRVTVTDSPPPLVGRLKVEIEDFEVEEVPAYEPSGEGPHVYLWVQKRDASAKWTLRKLASFFGVRRRDIGQAGLKDRRAVTRQWYSLPAHAIDEQALARMPGPVHENIEVLEVSRHRNKLRRGHLQGNRFRIAARLHEAPSPERVREHIEEVLGHIERQGGVPNYYGDQRFGHDGHTLELGLGLLRQESWARDEIGRDRFLRRLSLNAAQSDRFNAVVTARMRQGGLGQVWEGDVLARRDSGGVFVVGPDEQLGPARERVGAGEVDVTGPMFGPKMKEPLGRPAEIEAQALRKVELEPEAFAQFGKLCAGTRRPIRVAPEQLSWSLEEGGEALELRFFLPSGSYATIVCEQFLRAPEPGEDPA